MSSWLDTQFVLYIEYSYLLSFKRKKIFYGSRKIHLTKYPVIQLRDVADSASRSDRLLLSYVPSPQFTQIHSHFVSSYTCEELSLTARYFTTLSLP